MRWAFYGSSHQVIHEVSRGWELILLPVLQGDLGELGSLVHLVIFSAWSELFEGEGNSQVFYKQEFSASLSPLIEEPILLFFHISLHMHKLWTQNSHFPWSSRSSAVWRIIGNVALGTLQGTDPGRRIAQSERSLSSYKKRWQWSRGLHVHTSRVSLESIIQMPFLLHFLPRQTSNHLMYPFPDFRSIFILWSSKVSERSSYYRVCS